MKQKIVFFTHRVALFALTFLGQGVISLPVKNADEFTFLGYLAAVISLCLLLPAAVFVSNALFCDEACSGFKKAVAVIALLAVAVAALFLATDTFEAFYNFAAEVLLPDTAKWICIITFAAVVGFFLSQTTENVLKFFLVAFVFVFLAVIFFFLASLGDYKLQNIFIFRLPEWSGLFTQAKPYFLQAVLPSLIFPVYEALALKKSRLSAALSSAAVGSILLGLCILGSVLLFGAPLAGRLDYPYASAVSTVSVGRLFTRMDGFSYFIYFAAALAKITVCGATAFLSLKKIGSLLNKQGALSKI